ncbi:MAG: proline--tRNA ligase [Puniceicoccales bacterium]|nr:proline--tRNA ligase [Puniceicoccales bacterium]
MPRNEDARRSAIEPTRAKNFPEWYQQVIRAADLAELSAVRGCMVIKPNGYAIWERMQSILDGKFKETGHRNAYFPLFIPESYFEREAAHVEGFAKECAVVTHSRLARGPDGTLVPTSPLPEPLVVRPTSEMVIGESFARWVRSYRDLPLLINQWANVVRWEMRPRLFLRTVEFLWQEGHTAHETAEEALEETLRMLEVYKDFAEKDMCLPVLRGKKTAAERFPGAEETYAIEAMMQDGKALQAGTSHFLGQNFARACSIKFTGRDGQETFAWTSSWGVSTRLIGGLIMAHGDDDGIVLPPAIAPRQVAILPLIRGDRDGELLDWAEKLRRALLANDPSLRVEVDGRPLRGGEKFWQRVKEGTPIVVELGRREFESETVNYLRRDGMERRELPFDDFVRSVPDLLRDFGKVLYERQLALRRSRTVAVRTEKELREFFTAGGGFAEAHFCGDRALEERFCAGLSISTRCIPLDRENDVGPCIADPSRKGPLTIWARAY